MITFAITGSSVELPNPILGDSEQLQPRVKFEISMSKKVHTTVRPTTHSKLLMTFAALTATEKSNFETWLLAARGKLITYTDYTEDDEGNGVDWEGIILNDPVEFTRVGKNECSGLWTTTIDFQAVNDEVTE
jgi:hypothetical protein